jgi:hypothetical protein
VALAWHIVMRVRDNRVLATRRPLRLHLLRTVARFAGDHELLAAGLADTHLHLVCIDDRARLGRMVQRIGSSLQQTRKFGVAIGPLHPTEVRDQRHLQRAVRYILRQPAQHGIDVPDDESSNLPDLLGERVLFAESLPAVRRHLPRLDLRSLAAPSASAPLEDSLDWRRLPDAAAAAVGRPDLRGRGADLRLARAAMVAVAPPAGPERRLALRSLPRETCRRLRALPTSPALRRAVLAQLRRRSA